MFWQKHPVAALTFATFFLTSCGDDSKTADNSINGSDEGIVTITDKTISGVSQKGPFVNGSSVTVQELDGETLAQTGGSFEGKIKNDMGEFSVKVKKLESQYALLKATGFYRNEVTGEKSKSQVTLYALTNLSNRSEVNVNLLTHLAYERTLYLATEEELSVTEAKKQAETEVLKSFGIEGDFAAAEDLNIFGESDQNAALLAISILMQGDLSEADFSERLANYAADIETDGIWNDSKTATKIADWANEQSLGSGLTKIREKITKWELSADVPMFEKYVNNYWWQKYGLGTCESKREGEVLKNQNVASTNANEYYICKSKLWKNATLLEYDTYKKSCVEEGIVIPGNITENHYFCENNKWRTATIYETILGSCTEDLTGKIDSTEGKWFICRNHEWLLVSTFDRDTYKWHIGENGESKLGNFDKNNCYVFEDSIWRTGNANDCSLGLGGCTKHRQDTVGKGSDNVWYICDTKSWRNATTFEKDTFGWIDSTDGAIKKGNATDSIYMFDKTTWRAANDIEAKLGGCVTETADSVGKVDSTYYICKSKNWTEASSLEYDTYKWIAEKNEEVRTGQINKNIYYIYETSKKTWRKATTLEKDTYDYSNNRVWPAGTDGEIKKGSVTDSFYVYDATAWRTANDIEKILGGCTTSITDSIDNIGDEYYICKQRTWSIVPPEIYDTYKWPIGKDGDAKWGSIITTNCYVYDTSAEYNTWRYGQSDNCLLNLGGCTKGRDGEIKIKQNTNDYYVCENNSWREATANEENDCLTDGFCIACTINNQGIFDIRGEIEYVCDSKEWRKANCAEIVTKSLCTANDSAVIWECEGSGNFKIDYICSNDPMADEKLIWHPVRTPYEYTLTDWKKEKIKYYSKDFLPNAVFGEDFIDLRDQNVYKTVIINGYRVFAENLRYAGEDLKEQTSCYNNELRNCEIGGRYYSWTAALNLNQKWQNALASAHINTPHQGICPNGWHIPTKEEWQALFSGLPADESQMPNIKSWNYITGNTGFNALPVGYQELPYNTSYYKYGFYVNSGACFWSSTEESSDIWGDVGGLAYFACVYQNSVSLNYGNKGVQYKEDRMTVRCFEDQKNDE